MLGSEHTSLTIFLPDIFMGVLVPAALHCPTTCAALDHWNIFALFQESSCTSTLRDGGAWQV